MNRISQMSDKRTVRLFTHFPKVSSVPFFVLLSGNAHSQKMQSPGPLLTHSLVCQPVYLAVWLSNQWDIRVNVHYSGTSMRGSFSLAGHPERLHCVCVFPRLAFISLSTSTIFAHLLREKLNK